MEIVLIVLYLSVGFFSAICAILAWGLQNDYSAKLVKKLDTEKIKKLYMLSRILLFFFVCIPVLMHVLKISLPHISG